MLRRILIEGLFGHQTHDLTLPPQEPVLLLHGENGVGKSTLLEAVSYTQNQQWQALGTLPFEHLQLEVEPGAGASEGSGSATLKVIREVPQSSKPFEGVLRLILEHAGEVTQELEWPINWGPSGGSGSPAFPTPDWLQEWCREHPVLLLGSDRLSGPSGRAILQCAESMRSLLSKTLDQLLHESLAQDFRFLGTLGSLPEAQDVEELQQRLAQLRELIAELTRLGVLEEMELPDQLPALAPEQLPLVQAYIDQQLGKFSGLLMLRDRARQMLKLLHRRLRLKQVRLDRNLGYAVELPSGQLLPLDRLSSGEQHLIVLWHRLLFDTNPQTLVLLDEPELSWHVEWQYAFIDDLLHLAELTGGRFLVATHSPQIVGNHWDRTLEITV